VRPDEPSLIGGVAALLEARGERELGALVRRSIVEVTNRAERWSMGARDVTAHRIALVVSAADHVLLTSSAPRLAEVREAFATAVRSPETEMENLFLVLELPPSRTTFAQGYRDAPLRTFETPAADAVLGGAAALCRAMGDEASARALSRATLEDAFVTANDRTVRRFVLRLDAADFALTERQVEFGDRIMRAVRSAAATPSETTSAVFLAVRLVDVDSIPDAETALVRALERKNAVVVPIARDEQHTRFAVVYQEKLAVVQIVNNSSKRAWLKLKPVELKSTPTKIQEVQLSDYAMKSPEAAETASVDILREIGEN
jgi:hypothetical protein